MKSYTIAKGIIKAISFFLILGIAIYILYEIRSLIAYIASACVLALVGRPIVIFFEGKLNINRTYGAIITIIIIFVSIGGLVAMFVPMLTEQGRNLALFDFDAIQAELDKIYVVVSEYFGTSKEVVEEVVKDSTTKKDPVGETDGPGIPSFLDSLIKIFTHLSIGLFSVLFMAFFILKDQNSLQRFVLAMMPPSHRARAISSLEKIKNVLSRYFIGLLLQIFILFIIYGITLFWVGTENALIVAFFCALFNIVPYVGPLIGALLMILLTVTSHIEMNFSDEILPLIGYVMIGVTVGQLVDNFFSQPLIYSNSIKSHPMEIFVIIIAAGLLFGIGGMIVAIPAYAVIKVILKEFFRDNRFVRAWTKGI